EQQDGPPHSHTLSHAPKGLSTLRIPRPALAARDERGGAGEGGGDGERREDRRDQPRVRERHRPPLTRLDPVVSGDGRAPALPEREEPDEQDEEEERRAREEERRDPDAVAGDPERAGERSGDTPSVEGGYGDQVEEVDEERHVRKPRERGGARHLAQAENGPGADRAEDRPRDPHP